MIGISKRALPLLVTGCMMDWDGLPSMLLGRLRVNINSELLLFVNPFLFFFLLIYTSAYVLFDRVISLYLEQDWLLWSWNFFCNVCCSAWDIFPILHLNYKFSILGRRPWKLCWSFIGLWFLMVYLVRRRSLLHLQFSHVNPLHFCRLFL